VFSWRDEDQPRLDPYFRVVYAMQFVAVIAIVAGLLLTWWTGREQAMSGFDLLGMTTDDLEQRSPHVLAQPLVVLWALWPVVVVSGLRGFTGMLVTPVSYRGLALVMWGFSLLALGHFYINFGEDLPERSPLIDGHVSEGFWLTASSCAILGLLILTEYLIRPPYRDPFKSSRVKPSEAVDDAERLWQGQYMTCPYCGMLNEPGARACYNCKNLLFDFSRHDGKQ